MQQGIVAEKLAEGLQKTWEIYGDSFQQMLVDMITFLIGETAKDRIERLLIFVCAIVVYLVGKQILSKITDKLTRS